MEKKKDKNDTELRMSQAVLVITECFRRFKRRGVDYKTLKLYLIENDILDTGDMKAIDAVTSLDELEKIVPRTFTASETLLLWMEEKKMVSDIDDLEKIQFLYVLQRLVEDETKYHSKGDCKKRMKVFTTSRRLRSGNEKEESKDLLYYSLLHAIGNVYEVTRVQMKDKLLQYLCRHPAYRFDLKRIDPEAINDWLGFIDYLQGWETKGHPFVMHAFTEVFSVSLHVISAVTSEEYVLYPKRYFKKANTRRKTYLGHVQRHHYISLSEEPPNFEDLCGEIGGLQDHVKHLRRQMQSKQDENKTNIDRFSETIDDKDMEIIQLKKKIKQLTVDLQQTTKELEQVTQTARDMKSQFRFLFRFLGNMMDVFSSIDGSSNSKSLETTMLEQVTAQLKAAKETQSQSQSQSQFSESGFASNVDDCEDELFESFS